MIVEDAIKIIQNPQSSFEECVTAANCFVMSGDTPLQYLVECLSRKGLVAEIAATNLYARTKRPRVDKTVHAVSLDPKDWSDYLKEVGLAN